MSTAEAFAFLCGELIAVAGLAARPAGARLGLVIAVPALVVPVLVSAPALVRVQLAVGFVWCVLRAWDLAQEPGARRFPLRLLHLFAIVDTRRLTRAPRRCDVGAVLRFAVATAVIPAALACAAGADALAGWAHYALRWTAGAVVALAALEQAAGFIHATLAALGWAGPIIHDAPHRSRSVAEFWGARWNLLVGRILREHVFRPLAHRDPWLALTASFVVSAAIHGYLIGIAFGAAAALAWTAFFLLQPVLIAAERRLGVRHWPAAAAWTWTAGTLLALSPLVTEPALRMLV